LGEFRGGPAFYIERISEMVCCLFAVVSIISAGVLLPGVQANLLQMEQNAFEIDTWKSGIVVSIIVACIWWGKESQFTEFVVP
jgi:AGCS family alanine or glycine:cation symporter